MALVGAQTRCDLVETSNCGINYVSHNKLLHVLYTPSTLICVVEYIVLVTPQSESTFTKELSNYGNADTKL